MKKIIVLVCAVCAMAIGCSKEDSKDSCPLSPPSWVQGTWGYPGEDVILHTFTADNYVQKVAGSIIDYCELNKQPVIQVTELKKTDSEYTIRMYSGRDGLGSETITKVVKSGSKVKIDDAVMEKK